jgi:4a-hydroxytetrahydrobiopterin dehydratase
VFDGFLGSVDFVNRVARMAEKVDHHPDINIRWNKVTLALTTHSQGGLTKKDFALARHCDETFERNF